MEKVKLVASKLLVFSYYLTLNLPYESLKWKKYTGDLTKIRENTQLLHKRKLLWTADVLFVLFGINWFAYAELETYLLVGLNPNQSNRRSVVQWYFPLQSTWAFSTPLDYPFTPFTAFHFSLYQ